MSTAVEKVFRTTLQHTEEWLEELMRELGTSDPHLAQRALRATLHVLRDRLTPQEAIDLAAQLPMLVRGLYFEGWVPRITPIKRSRQQFLEKVRELVDQSDPDADAEPAVRAVFRVLAKHVSAGEMGDVKQVLPHSFGSLFSPAEAAVAES